MSWTKDALFERSPDLTVQLQRSGRITVVHHGREHKGGHNTVRILEAFASPVPMEKALEALRPSLQGFGAFTEVMDEVRHLIELGVIVDISRTDGGLDIGTHDDHYDSFPVHIRMLNDASRTIAYQEAIRKTVRPDDVVLEIGTGTGVLTATAALAGARHVYTIERTAIARMARQIFEANGILDRITQIDETSLRAELPEKATVFVSEMIGNDPLAEDMRRMTVDAVRRLLTPDARILPERMRIFGLPLTVPESQIAARRVTAELSADWKQRYHVDFSPMARASAGREFVFSRLPQAARDWPRVADPILLLDLDLRTAEGVDIEVTHTFTANPGGVLSGILVYFEALLGPAGWLSTAPDVASATNHWGSHIWVPGAPVTLQRGEVRELTYVVRNDRSGFRLGGRPGT